MTVMSAFGTFAKSKARGFRRARCPGCRLWTELCLCPDYAPLESRLRVSIVMPSTEANSSSNTARLLGLWLRGTEIYVRGGSQGPSYTSERMPALDAESALLFPLEHSPADAALGGEADGRCVDSAAFGEHKFRHLIVPDGTWAQARRLARRELLPLGLPRLTLHPAWPSIYGLRRKPQGVCTFEAVAIALALSGELELARQLLARFALWNQRQTAIKQGGEEPSLAWPAPPPHPALALLER
jgi:DTW domain-containing protein